MYKTNPNYFIQYSLFSLFRGLFNRATRSSRTLDSFFLFSFPFLSCVVCVCELSSYTEWQIIFFFARPLPNTHTRSSIIYIYIYIHIYINLYIYSEIMFFSLKICVSPARRYKSDCVFFSFLYFPPLIL